MASFAHFSLHVTLTDLSPHTPSIDLRTVSQAASRDDLFKEFLAATKERLRVVSLVAGEGAAPSVKPTLLRTAEEAYDHLEDQVRKMCRERGIKDEREIEAKIQKAFDMMNGC